MKPTPTDGFEHHIHTGSHSRHLDPEKLEIAKAEFKKLELAGIIRHSKLQWASPLHMVPKKDRSSQHCGDYRHLNLLTTLDKYPLPNMHDLSIGLSNTAQTFQRMMEGTTDGLEGVFANMDNSCVGSPDRQTHLHHLEAFFTALTTNGLAINLEKCVFEAPSLEILGHTISAAPTADHAAEIVLCPPPQDIKQLQRFLGMAKCLLAAAVPLQHPTPTAELSLATDAFDTHIRGVMMQKSGDHW